MKNQRYIVPTEYLRTSDRKAKRKMGQTTIESFKWLRLIEKVERSGRTAYLVKYYKGNNVNGEHVISTKKADVKKVWNEIIKDLEEIDPADRREFIVARLPETDRWLNRTREKDHDWGKTKLGQQCKKFVEMYSKKRVCSNRKTHVKKVMITLLNHSAGCETLTNQVLKRLFDKLQDKKGHYSPKTIRDYRSVLSTFIKEMAIKDNGLWQGIFLSTRKQLKDDGISFSERNRQHFDRASIARLARQLIESDDKQMADGAFIQLWTGSRPNDARRAELGDSSMRIYHQKVGKESIQVRDRLFNAFLEVISYQGGHAQGKDPAQAWSKIVTETLPRKLHHMDRYCLRHSAIVWKMKSGIDFKEISDFSGTSLRMLDESYARQPVLDQLEWSEVMPIGLEYCPENWYGFLVEATMLARWPELKDGMRPDDLTFERVLNILKDKKETKRKISF